MLKQRVVTALILGVLTLLAIFFLPDLWWGGLVALVVVMATYEWSKLLGISRVPMLVLMAVVAAPVLVMSTTPVSGDGHLVLLTIYACSVCFWAFTVPAWLHIKPDLAETALAYLVGVILFVPTSLAMLELRRIHPGLLLLAILGVCVADITAFFVGRAFGKRKLAPEISPGKSWEGFAGGVLGVVLFVLFAAIWWLPPLIGSIGIVGVIIFALCFALVSVEGDLFESLIKRKAGVKDSGALLPGHGGVLDRIDSMLSTLPLAGALLAAWQYF